MIKRLMAYKNKFKLLTNAGHISFDTTYSDIAKFSLIQKENFMSAVKFCSTALINKTVDKKDLAGRQTMIKLTKTYNEYYHPSGQFVMKRP